MNGAARYADITAITFDAGGTLLRPHPSVGAVYRDVALRHGATLDAEAVNEAFGHAFHSVSKSPLLLNPEARERDFWRRVVVATLETAGATPKDFAAFFADVWEVFAHGACWRLLPGVRETLETLRARGYRLAVLSNWDQRLHRVLAETELRPLFDHVLISSEVGVEKPDPGIFHAAESALGARPAQCLHVGDSPQHDIAGAEGAGWNAFLVSRNDSAIAARAPGGCLADLLALLPGPAG